MAAGYRSVIDSAWEEVAEQSLGTAEAGQVVWMSWDYSTEEVPGHWDVGLGSEPVQDESRNVTRIARIVDSDGSLVVVHEHLGNIQVLDIGDCA